MGQIITVDNLISDTRSMLDEHNILSVDDDVDILPALNRAQRYASNILTRHYEPPMLRHRMITPVANQIEYEFPEDALEERLEKVEMKIGGLYYPLTYISYRDLSIYESFTGVAVPRYYTTVGRRIRLVPASNGTYPIRIWYLAEPMNLVKSQGRINDVDTASMSVIVDAVGEDLDTQVDNLASYVNIIDAQTGERKATFQIRSISGNQITFKTTPSRSSVQGTTIDTSMTTLSVNTDSNNEGPDVSISEDDYVCLLAGTCIPFFKNPFSNFLTQYAVAEIRRKLGGASDLEQIVLQKLEKQVERSWVGRENGLRVKKANTRWMRIW